MGKSLPDVMGPSQSVSPTLLLEARNLTRPLEGEQRQADVGREGAEAIAVCYGTLLAPVIGAFRIPPHPSFKLQLDPGYHAIPHI